MGNQFLTLLEVDPELDPGDCLQENWLCNGPQLLFQAQRDLELPGCDIHVLETYIFSQTSETAFTGGAVTAMEFTGTSCNPETTPCTPPCTCTTTFFVSAVEDGSGAFCETVVPFG